MPQVRKQVEVEAPVGLVYRIWRNLPNLSLFMDHVHDVRTLDERRSHWKATGALGAEAEWDAEITIDQPEREIAWQSVEGQNGMLQTKGHVRFDDLGSGRTRIDVALEYATPAGVVSDIVAKMFADPEREVEEDLARFKQAVEHEQEQSRFEYEQEQSSEMLGASMGTTTPGELEEISRETSAVSPKEIDDPATRDRH